MTLYIIVPNKQFNSAQIYSPWYIKTSEYSSLDFCKISRVNVGFMGSVVDVMEMRQSLMGPYSHPLR